MDLPSAPEPKRLQPCTITMIDNRGTSTCTLWAGHHGLHAWKSPEPPVIDYGWNEGWVD